MFSRDNNNAAFNDNSAYNHNVDMRYIEIDGDALIFSSNQYRFSNAEP